MDVGGKKMHVSSPTWNFCIHMNVLKATLIENTHFTYERGITVFINSMFHVAKVEFSGKYHIHTRTCEAHRPEKILCFYGYYCIYITILILYDGINVIYI